MVAPLAVLAHHGLHPLSDPRPMGCALSASCAPGVTPSDGNGATASIRVFVGFRVYLPLALRHR